MIPGEVIPRDGEITLNAGREAITLAVANTGDRPVQVGSHYHFFETNAALAFDRAAARGRRLDIPAGTAVRFEPGQTREVQLVPIAGARRIFGFNGLVQARSTRRRPPDAPSDWARRLCRHVRADGRRPGAARRHRAVHRGRGGPHDLWRGGQVRRRQGDPRRHGPVAGDPRGRARSTR